jgi:hypothetical protein
MGGRYGAGRAVPIAKLSDREGSIAVVGGDTGLGTKRASGGGPVAAVAGGNLRLDFERALTQVPPADLQIPILGQYAVAELALGDALKPGPL